MALGLVCAVWAAGISAENAREDRAAGAASARALAQVRSAIASEPTAEAEEEPYIGLLTIPRLELELPIQAQWDDARLKIAPCRFLGSAEGADLVLVGHNYKRHFGPIRRLKPGDEVLFQDMDGNLRHYQVTATATVAPTALEEITAAHAALTLITCTYGGTARVVVYCEESPSL